MYSGREKFTGLQAPSIKESVILEAEVSEVDFTDEESLAAYKAEVFEQVADVVKKSSLYFTRASAEHTLRSYDKIGLQHTALIRAFYSKFQLQCTQAEKALADGQSAETSISQLNRSYEIIQAQIEIVNGALRDALADIPEANAELEVSAAKGLSRTEARFKFQTILRKGGVPDGEIISLTRKSIDQVYADVSLSAYPEQLNQKIKSILSNAEKQVVPQPSIEVVLPAEEVLLEQPERLTSEIDSQLEILNDLLVASKTSTHAEQLTGERNQGMRLRDTLLRLKRRQQQVEEPNSFENDPVPRANILTQTAKEIQVLVSQANELKTTVEQKILSLETADVPVADVVEPLVAAPEQPAEVEISQTDLMIHAERLTSQAFGHEDAPTVATLWENYHRLQTEDGTTGKIRQILESIIELTETVGLTPQAFEKQLQSVFLTHVERQTARQLYQKYQQRQKIGLSPETLARDLDDIANFVSIEGVGVETIVDRVNELEVAVTNSPWPSSPAENVLANFRAMIKDVRTQVASLPANIERIKATFNVLQGYYLDQLRQQSETNAAVKKQLTPTTRPLPQFMTAQDRLVSIQSAIAAGTISQRAIDEFLDSAIDDVEREKRTAEPEVVPGVVLEDPAPVVEREPNTPIFSTRVDKEQTPQEPGVPETISNINTSVDRFSLEGVTKFKAEYRPSQEAYADDFQSWVESIQGKHSRNFFRIFNASESVDAFDALKNHSISEIYNIARNPTLKLPPLKIKPEDFQQWSNFMTRIFRISEVMISVSNDATFGELAELGFMYDTITQK